MDVGTFCAQSHVLVVAGKGGVGKTTMSAALAKMAAGAGKSVLIVELEGKSGITGAFGRREDLGYEEMLLAPAATAHRPRDRLGAGPADHPRRRAHGVSRRPRLAARVQATGAFGSPRRGVDGDPWHPRRAGPGQGQATGAGGRRRFDRGGRPRHGSCHHVPDLRQRVGERRPRRPSAHPGPGRGRSAQRSGPLPGDPGHAPRGAPGLGDGRVCLYPRGQGGRAARAGDRQRLRSRAARAGAAGVRGGRGSRGDAGPRAPDARSRRPGVSASPAMPCPPSRSSGCAAICPSPSS